MNLYGAMYCTRAVLPAMIDAKWGRIVTIVSDDGRTGDANGAAYAASKAGAAGLTRSHRRRERAPRGHGQQHRARDDANTR